MARLRNFTDDEIVVLDCAISNDEGNWHDEEREGIRKALADELMSEVDRRGLIPHDGQDEGE